MVSPAPSGPDHYAWKGDAVSPKAGRERAVRRYPMGPCESCGEPGRDRHHVDGNTANNEPGNIEILCRRCHMKRDGRRDAFTAIGAEASRQRAAAQTECSNGHSLTDEANVYRRKDRPDTRNCRRCRADAEQRRRARLRDQYGPGAHHRLAEIRASEGA